MSRQIFGGLLDESRQSFRKVTWAASDPPGGFVPFLSSVLDGAGETIAVAPELISLSEEVPTVEEYEWTERQMVRALAWSKEPRTNENIQRIQPILLAAQQSNPIDPLVLMTEINLGEQAEDLPYAMKAATLLTQVRPADGLAFRLLAESLVLSSEFDRAEAALGRAASLKVPPPQLAECYARVHLGRKDKRGALPYLAQAIVLDQKRQDLWLMQADAAEDLHDLPLAIQSLEHGLALSATPSPQTATLLRLYLANNQTSVAQQFARHMIETLPANAELRTEFAEACDAGKLPAESLAAWRSVLSVQPDAEHAHTRVAQLLLESGDKKGAEAAATLGLQSVPRSGSLYRAKADAMTQQGRAYEGRSALEEGASSAEDSATLLHLAAAQELYGDRGAEAYLRLAKTLAKGSTEQVHALESGFNVALRDGDLNRAAVFAAALGTAGKPQYKLILGEKRQAVNETIVPGGLDAFSFVARVRRGLPLERFFGDYARQVVASACTNCIGDHYVQTIQAYFATIAELESLGRRNGNVVSITLSLSSKEEKNHTQNVLRLLGLQMHNEKGQIHLDRGEKQSQNKKQDVLTGLGMDEVGLQEAMQTGKPFTFEIQDESVPVYPSAKAWKEAFRSSRKSSLP